MPFTLCYFLIFVFLIGCHSPEKSEKETLANQMEHHLKSEVLNNWYPQALDTVDGGFLSNFSYDFKPGEKQEKMIVTQYHHIWTNAKSVQKYPDVKHYKTGAKRGFEFLRDKMWEYCDTYLIDHEHGDWYSGGLDKQPELKTAGKGNIWKGIYHHYRSLDHCIARLNPDYALGIVVKPETPRKSASLETEA